MKAALLASYVARVREMGSMIFLVICHSNSGTGGTTTIKATLGIVQGITTFTYGT
jgi:hypothetical protein